MVIETPSLVHYTLCSIELPLIFFCDFSLYGNWSCPLMNPYISSERKNIQEYLNYTSEAPSTFGKILESLSTPIREPQTQYNLENASRFSASFYTGALNSGRQPLVLYEGNMYSRYHRIEIHLSV
jgi:hypothetical protein